MKMQFCSDAVHSGSFAFFFESMKQIAGALLPNDIVYRCVHTFISESFDTAFC